MQFIRVVSVLKFIAGVGIPVDLNTEAVTMGFVFKASFLLPKNVSELDHILGDPFDVQTHPLRAPARRSVSTEEDVNDVEDDENRAKKLSSMRWNVYKGLATYAERYCSSHFIIGRTTNNTTSNRFSVVDERDLTLREIGEFIIVFSQFFQFYSLVNFPSVI